MYGIIMSIVIPIIVTVHIIKRLPTSGHSVNVSKNKMAYEVIMAYYLHMPLLL